MKTLTFAETLHPELYPEDNEGVETVSPWETFFKEARGDIPIAIAERVDESSTVQVPSQGEVTAVSESQTESPSRPLGKGCFYLEGLVGSVLALAVALLVFSLELTGALVYVLAVAFNNIASMQGMPTLLKAIFLLVVHTFMVVDSICLLCSVMISEVFGFVTALVMLIFCACSGDCYKASQQWYQYIRKVSHLTRWAFRSFHWQWKPERVFPLDFMAPDSSSHEQRPQGESNQDRCHTIKDDVTIAEASVTFVESGDGPDPVEKSKAGHNTTSIVCAPEPPDGYSAPSRDNNVSDIMSDDTAIVVDVENGTIRKEGKK
mmetsp:Transcript_19809/g.35715  ORF Transcript_19809/g.35715 Transcript_19809/m.35715 type:complete len:319 (+) Transcript_19809:161-1117(+)